MTWSVQNTKNFSIESNTPLQSKIDELLSRGVSKIIDEKSLRARLEAYEAADPAERVPLRIKFGIDPTGTIVHLGHMVPILKLRAFQDLGHTIVLIIGDATAQVGDTSDKDGERPMLTRDKTRENASNWLSLFAKVLILPPITPPEGISVESKSIYQGDPRYGVPAPALLNDGSTNPLAGRIPGTFELRYNSEWMDSTNFNAVGELAANFSVAEMLDRDNFSKRYNGGVRISLQEFLYPIMQGLDSVAIHADVELGGNDQYFNLLAGRRLQEAHGQHKQEVMTFDLLVGPDGKKMSKTGGNTIAVNMPPNEMFVKAMEVADHLVWDFFKLTTQSSLESLEVIKNDLENGTLSIIDAKLSLATHLVTQYYSTTEAQSASEYYIRVIKNKELPAANEFVKAELAVQSPTLTLLLKELKCFGTTGDVRNAIQGKSITVAGELATSPNQIVELNASEWTLITVWKKKFFAVFYAPNAA